MVRRVVGVCNLKKDVDNVVDDVCDGDDGDVVDGVDGVDDADDDDDIYNEAIF